MRKLSYLILAIGLFSAPVFAENDRPVYLRPAFDSPIIGNLPEGAFVMSPLEEVELSDQQQDEGWEPIAFLDNFEGFVRNADLSKDLYVEPGARIYSREEADPRYLITTAEENDSFEVENVSGDWAKVTFRKPITAFIQSDPAEETPPIGIGTATLAETDESDIDPQPSREETLKEIEEIQKTSSKPISRRKAIPEDGILRAYEGWMNKPRRFLREPPYPFQVVDSSGSRIAYLDLSRLLITTPLEHFLGRRFHFYGRAEPIEGKRDFVIRVEQMELR